MFNEMASRCILAMDQQTVMLIAVMGAVLAFWLVMGRGGRKDPQREKMLSELARNDRVTTISGVMGVVTDVRDDEVTIKVDEGNNTKIRMKKWAIRAVEVKPAGPEADKK